MHERYRQTTDRRQTDGRATAYSEREREFTFAKNYRKKTETINTSNSLWTVWIRGLWLCTRICNNSTLIPSQTLTALTKLTLNRLRSGLFCAVAVRFWSQAGLFTGSLCWQADSAQPIHSRGDSAMPGRRERCMMGLLCCVNAKTTLGDISHKLSQIVRGSPAAKRFWCVIYKSLFPPQKREQRLNIQELHNGYS